MKCLTKALKLRSMMCTVIFHLEFRLIYYFQCIFSIVTMRAVEMGGGDFLSFIQVVLVSATMPQEVLDMTSKFMSEPIKV